MILAAILGQAVPVTSGHRDAETYDCGTLSLYLLVRLEGCGASLKEVERRLPDGAGAYSLLDLRDAGRAMGVGWLRRRSANALRAG